MSSVKILGSKTAKVEITHERINGINVRTLVIDGKHKMLCRKSLSNAMFPDNFEIKKPAAAAAAKPIKAKKPAKQAAKPVKETAFVMPNIK